MACGVLLGGHWHAPIRKPDFLFPVHALSKVLRGKFLQALGDAHSHGQIQHDPQASASAWRKRQRALWHHDWMVYAKAPLGGPAQALEYLARNTHRTAIGNERIRVITDNEVVFTVRAAPHGGKRAVRLAGGEFVRRVLLHVLPTSIKRIRHYGVLAPACKGVKLDAARRDLHMPIPEPRALESARAFLLRVARIDAQQCPCCERGQLRCVQALSAPRTLTPPTQTCNRGRP